MSYLCSTKPKERLNNEAKTSGKNKIEIELKTQKTYKIMKAIRTLFISIMMLIGTSAFAQPMNYNAIRNNARFLTDRMAYTLGINNPLLLDDIYRINYDYICGINDYLDDIALGYRYDDYEWLCEERDYALRMLLGDMIWNRLITYDYFYRPIIFENRRWRFGIYAYDYNRTHFYFGVPRYYNSGYRGGHFFGGMRPSHGIGDRGPGMAHWGARGPRPSGSHRGDVHPGNNGMGGNHNMGGNRNDRPGNFGGGSVRDGGNHRGGNMGGNMNDRPMGNGNMNGNRPSNNGTMGGNRSMGSENMGGNRPAGSNYNGGSNMGGNRPAGSNYNGGSNMGGNRPAGTMGGSTRSEGNSRSSSRSGSYGGGSSYSTPSRSSSMGSGSTSRGGSSMGSGSMGGSSTSRGGGSMSGGSRGGGSFGGGSVRNGRR